MEIKQIFTTQKVSRLPILCKSQKVLIQWFTICFKLIHPCVKFYLILGRISPIYFLSFSPKTNKGKFDKQKRSTPIWVQRSSNLFDYYEIVNRRILNFFHSISFIYSIISYYYILLRKKTINYLLFKLFIYNLLSLNLKIKNVYPISLHFITNNISIPYKFLALYKIY